MSELPKGWEDTTLGEVCSKPQYGYTTKADPVLGEVKFLRTTDITKGLLNWDTVPFCMEPPSEPSKYQLVVGDIVIARSGSVGVSYLIDKAYEPAVFASYLIRFKPITPVLSEYVKAFLDSHLFWEQVEVNKAGNALQNINAQKLSAMSFPLAPLAEQKRIVEKLDEVLAQVDTIKARLDGIPDLLKRFRQSVLASAVSGKLTEEFYTSQAVINDITEEWIGYQEETFRKLGKQNKSNTWMKKAPAPINRVEFSDRLPKGKRWCAFILDEIILAKNQGVNTTTEKVEYTSSGIVAVQAGNIQESKIDFQSNKFVSKDKFDALSCHVKPAFNDVLYTNIGANFGNAAVVPEILEDFLITWNVMRIVPSKILLPKYLELVLNSSLIRDIALTAVSTSTVPFVNGKTIGQYVIPTPPIEEQKEIVRLVDQYFAFADTIEAQVKKAQARVDNLTQSILAKAFRGELVPQHPNDEPADKLLERITEARKEAEALAKAAKKAEAAKKRAAKSV
ncbi:type I restriction-modification system specificity subunit [Vibrio owensii]